MQGFPETQQMHKSRERHSRPYFKLFTGVVGHRTESEGQIDYVRTWVNYLASLRLSFSTHRRVHLVTENMLSVLYPLFSYVYSKIEEKVQSFFTLLPPLPHNLSHYQHSTPEWCMCYSWWSYTKAWWSPKVQSLSYDLLMKWYILWVWETVMTCVHHWVLCRVFSLL